jgi:integrase
VVKKNTQDERVVEKNITARCDGYSYRVRMMLGGIRINETFDTLREARAYRDRIRADSTTDPTHRLVLEAKQRKEEAANTTLDTLLQRYLTEITPTKRGAQVEATKIGKLRRYEIARTPICLIGRDAITRFMATARKEGWKDNTLRKYLMLLSSVFQVAVKRWGMSLENPVRVVQVPGNGKARERRLEPGECDRILAELKRARNPYVASVFEFAIETAARRGEIIKLYRKDVDLANATAVLRNTKNGDDRVIPLSTKAVEVIKRLPATIGTPVFPVSEEQLRQAWEAAKRRARQGYEAECLGKGITPEVGYISDLRFHDLRHEATSRLFEKGLNLMEVASITGHRTLEMLKRYTHLRASDLAAKLG